MLKFKPDFKQAADRIEAWWHSEITDRVPVAVTAHKDPVRSLPEPLPGSIAERWWRKDFVLEAAYSRLKSRVFKGEALPVFTPDLGAYVFSGFLGGEIIFSEQTTYVRSSNSLSDLSAVSMDPDNSYYRWLVDCLRKALKQARGTYLAGIPFLQNPLDCILSLISFEELEAGIHTKRDLIENAISSLQNIWENVFAEFSSPLLKEYGGIPGPLSLFHRGTYHLIGLNIHSEQQIRTMLPLLKETVASVSSFLDRSLYRFDRPVFPEYVKAVLDIPSLTGICIAGGSIDSTTEIAELAQQSGKCIYIILSREEIQPALSRIADSRGIMLSTTARNEAEADTIINTAADFA